MTSDPGLALVVGGGPAGLMAAETLVDAGVQTVLVEGKPSLGRKFLMAGKSGLNLTKDEDEAAFLRGFFDAAPNMMPMLATMGPGAVQRFARDLGQDIFTGSSGQVFPKAMKASPLLRAWLLRLAGKGVQFRTRWRWTGWQGDALTFQTPDGLRTLKPDVSVLALGGASWSRLGSDGAWSALLAQKDVPITPFAPANMGFVVPWSDHMAPHFGKPVKPVALMAGDVRVTSEFTLSKHGLEGSGIYAVSRAMRQGSQLFLDLVPGLSMADAADRLARPRKGASLGNHLRKSLHLDPVKRALVMEFSAMTVDGLPQDPLDLAGFIKALPVVHSGPRPLDEAISVAGGVGWDGLDDGLMLKALPGTYCAGEMLDWEAPTGGYLITGCLASGKWAGAAAAQRVTSA